MHQQIANFQMPDDTDVGVAADAFRMLSDKNRIKILVALLQGESSVNCLAELIDASPSAVSPHLAKLRLAGLVQVTHPSIGESGQHIETSLHRDFDDYAQHLFGRHRFTRRAQTIVSECANPALIGFVVGDLAKRDLVGLL